MGASGPGLCFLAFFAALSGGVGAVLSSATPGGGGGGGGGAGGWAVVVPGLSTGGGGGGRLPGGVALVGGVDCGAGEGSGVEVGGRPVWAKAEPAYAAAARVRATVVMRRVFIALGPNYCSVGM